jgi:signal transduction histidine kinase/DNA-binding response OmpR family regulator/ABC-type xylose transport system substrate-binding protein
MVFGKVFHYIYNMQKLQKSVRKTYLYVLCIALVFVSCTRQRSKYTIGISQCSDDEWRWQQNTEMLQEAAIRRNIKIIIKTSVDNTAQQIKDIENLIKQGVDMLIVSPNEAEPLTPIIKNAYNRDIPILLIDRKILSDDYTAYIGADNEKIGEDVGEYVARMLQNGGNVVEIMGLEGSTPAQERHRGFVKAIKNNSQIKIIESVDGLWLKDTAYKRMLQILQKERNISLVFAQNDRMALGAYNAAQEMNRDNKIKFIGIDALSGEGGGIEMVLQGILSASFIYPTAGDKIITLAEQILSKDSFEKNNILSTSVVDRLNARILDLQTKQIKEKENRISQLNERIGTYEQRQITSRNVTIIIIIALILFAIVLVLMVFAYRSRNRKIVLLNERNAVIDKQKDRLQQQNEQLTEQKDKLIELSAELESTTQSKLVFFTNISHEFRTPLTLISGPVNSLLADKDTGIEHRHLLNLIQKNVKVLLKLIDQIIDFRKYENGKMNLCLQRGNLQEKFNEWGEAFAELAKKKSIVFTSDIGNGDFNILFDFDKIERIYFNLLANAIKFTPEKGRIDVALGIDKEYFTFTVLNSGKTVEPKNLQHIFDRFYQVDENRGGSGIGLALVKAMVELHGGDVSVKSEDNTITFTVKIPIAQESEETQKDIQHFSIVKEMLETVQPETADITFFDDKMNGEKDTILVIDDNVEIRTYIRSVLTPDFNVIEAKDGKDGFQKAVKYVPDLILCDIMMPQPDGFELTKMLKKEFSTQHIPVILLTAYSLDEQRKIGLQSGADDFIAKPFNAELLYVRIKTMLENRKKLRDIFVQQRFSTEAKDVFKKENKSFVDRVKVLIEERLEDTELDVNFLASEMALSTTQFNRKLKSMTGYSPVELKRIIRLTKAQALLGSTELNITEIAYKTGFNTLAYFTNCYKKYYGESPTDYVKRVRGR